MFTAGLYGMKTRFEESHEIREPSFFWKVIFVVKEDGKLDRCLGNAPRQLAFWMLNAATKRNVNTVLSIEDLEKKLEEYGQPTSFDFPDKESCYGDPCSIWPEPSEC